MTPERALAAVSVTWRQVSSGPRAALAGEDDALWASLQDQGAHGLLCLHTCARSLWVVSAEDGAWAGRLIQGFAARRLGGVFPPVLEGLDAARFALRVSAGLDSFVQGESDVGAQMRRAMHEAEAQGRLDGPLHHLQQAVRVLLDQGRRDGFIRPNRGLGALAVGALRRAHLDVDAVVGIVGAGAIAARVTSALRRAGYADPVVYNRSPRPGTVPLSSLEASNHPAYVLCSAAPRPWFAPPRDAVVVDLGMPVQSLVPAIGLDDLLGGEGLHLPPERVAAAEVAVESVLRGFSARVRAAEARRHLDDINRLRDAFLDEDLPAFLGERALDAATTARLRPVLEDAIRRYNHRVVTMLRDAFAEEGP